MSENEDMNIRAMILDSAARIFTDLSSKELLDKAETGTFPDGLWKTVVDNGFSELGTKESGTTRKDAFAFLVLCGQHALPLPMAEALLARQIAPELQGFSSIGIIQDGAISDVPWGRQAQNVIGLSANGEAVIIVESPKVIAQSSNIAGEPRDTIAIPDNAKKISISGTPLLDLALSRTCLLAGALESILKMGIQYSTERYQFGRPLAKFQVLQHMLAHAATEVSASRLATDVAISSIDSDEAPVEIAVACARAAEAAQVVTENVHQIHGAMGFTHEHKLHHFTRRVWAWREEYGNEFRWQAKLGQGYSGLSPDQVWQKIVER